MGASDKQPAAVADEFNDQLHWDVHAAIYWVSEQLVGPLFMAAAWRLALGDFTDHCLDVPNHAIGFRQRGSCRGQIIDDEAALIYFGQRIGAKLIRMERAVWWDRLKMARKRMT